MAKATTVVKAPPKYKGRGRPPSDYVAISGNSSEMPIHSPSGDYKDNESPPDETSMVEPPCSESGTKEAAERIESSCNPPDEAIPKTSSSSSTFVAEGCVAGDDNNGGVASRTIDRTTHPLLGVWTGTFTVTDPSGKLYCVSFSKLYIVYRVCVVSLRCTGGEGKIDESMFFYTVLGSAQRHASNLVDLPPDPMVRFFWSIYLVKLYRCG
jgi:hypothetical protein